MVRQVRQIGSAPRLVQGVHEEALRQQEDAAPRLEAEYRQLLTQRHQRGEELKPLLSVVSNSNEPLPSVTEKIRETEELAAALDERLADLKVDIDRSRRLVIDADHLRETLRQFDPIWNVPHQADRVQLVQQVVEVVHYDAADDSVRVTFRYAAPDQLSD